MMAIDHRLALVLLSALILAAAAPLVMAWMRLLPPEREPFDALDATPRREPRDSIAILLLCFTTLSYLARLPGVPLEAFRLWLEARFLAPWPEYLFLAITFFLVFAPAFAACYSLLRRNPMRTPLIWAGVLVLLFWLASPYLLVALTAAD